MKNKLIIIGLLAINFYANAQSQQVSSTNNVWSNSQWQQTTIDTTLFKQPMFFAEKDQPSYHLKKAGANFGAATCISIVGGFATGLLASVPTIDTQNQKTTEKTTNEKNEAIQYAYIVGGVTALSAIIFTIIAATELKAAGKSMDKIQINSNGVAINF